MRADLLTLPAATSLSRSDVEHLDPVEIDLAQIGLLHNDTAFGRDDGFVAEIHRWKRVSVLWVEAADSPGRAADVVALPRPDG